MNATENNVEPLSLRQTLKREIKAVALAAVYFGCWLAALLLLKQLVLAEYQIEFRGMSTAIVGALVLSKVVLVLEHVPLGAWVSRQPAWVDVVLRTALYAFGVLVVLVLEKAFEGRREYGGIGASLSAVFQRADSIHVWLNTLCLSGALLGYNLLSVIRRHLGAGGLLRLFATPLPQGSGNGSPESSA